MAEQLTLFADDDLKPQVKRPRPTFNASNNPIVFHDYESFIAKFEDNPKTTDDCYTPKDIYEAVVRYVGTVVDLSEKEILRPFYPGGDYENAEYPEDGIVIDNPPFSMFTNICKFYCLRKIPFFLFGPGMTIASCCKFGATAVIIAKTVEWSNGAQVRLNFASNLFGDELIRTAPQLDEWIKACPSQNQKVNLPKFRYPDELLSISDMEILAKGGIDFRVTRREAIIVKKLDLKPNGQGLFGDHFLLSATKGADKEAARQRAQEAARQRAQEAARQRAQEAARQAIPIELSPRERRIVERLNQNTKQ